MNTITLPTASMTDPELSAYVDHHGIDDTAADIECVGPGQFSGHVHVNADGTVTEDDQLDTICTVTVDLEQDDPDGSPTLVEATGVWNRWPA